MSDGRDKIEKGAKGDRIKLTKDRIAKATSDGKSERYLWDTEAPGLGLRVRAGGSKSFVFGYRVLGRGRDGQFKRVRIGDAAALSLDQARIEARALAGEVARGVDPASDRRAAREEEKARKAEQEALDARLRLRVALQRYDAHLEMRQVRDRRNVISALTRHLLESDYGIGDVPLVEIDRAAIMAVVEKLETGEAFNEADAAPRRQPGAARSLRQKATTFLNWAANRGHVPLNPLAGMRRERETKPDEQGSCGRMLLEAELGVIWRACADAVVSRALGAVVRVLILTGQRRTETSLMRWEDVDLDEGWWVIPAHVAKNGKAHIVPLPLAVSQIIDAQPRFVDCPFVFTSSGTSPLSGWSKLEPKLRAKADLAEPWTLHDLRRSFRSGLTRLGADHHLGELMINHRPKTLRSIYDREERLDERRAMAERWAEHLRPFLDEHGTDDRTVLPFPRRRYAG
jgi:integrase